MKKVSLFLAFQIILCLFVFSGCSAKKTENNNEIMYQDKILSLEMTKDDIDDLLGEGSLVDQYQIPGKDRYIYKYIYEELKISYYMDNGINLLYISGFSWTTPDIFSYTGVTVGENIRKLDDLSHETDNVENGKKYSIYFYSNNDVIESGEDKYTIAESKQTFIYNDKNKITEIVVAKATDK